MDRKLEEALAYVTSPDREWNKKFVRDALRRVRFAKIISDPFPEHTQYEVTMQMLGPIERFFGIFGKDVEKPKHISIHEAYQKGYNQAYKEIEAALGDKELK